MHRFAIGLSIPAGYGNFASAAAAEYRGTCARQLACTPDVMRLCGSEIPDVGGKALRRNEARLDASCRAVFQSNAEATPGDIAAKPRPPAAAPGAVSPPAR